MEITEVLGYSSALLIGLVLGLIGGGGSILTVPVLVYILHMNSITATAYSLFVVGSTAMVGACKNMQHKLVDYYYGFVFGVPAIIGVTLTRKYAVPNLPDVMLGMSKEDIIMIFFAFIMLLAGMSMLSKKLFCKLQKSTTSSADKSKYPLIIAEGLIVGAITGFVGAGGGFLIIPALIFLAKLPMKEAVGTSLFIITIKSLVGFFLGDVTNMTVDWSFLLPFTLISIIGILLGIYFSKYISGEKLKKVFGVFVFIMSFVVIFKTFVC